MYASVAMSNDLIIAIDYRFAISPLSGIICKIGWRAFEGGKEPSDQDREQERETILRKADHKIGRSILAGDERTVEIS